MEIGDVHDAETRAQSYVEFFLSAQAGSQVQQMYLTLASDTDGFRAFIELGRGRYHYWDMLGVVLADIDRDLRDRCDPGLQSLIEITLRDLAEEKRDPAADLHAARVTPENDGLNHRIERLYGELNQFDEGQPEYRAVCHRILDTDDFPAHFIAFGLARPAQSVEREELLPFARFVCAHMADACSGELLGQIRDLLTVVPAANLREFASRLARYRYGMDHLANSLVSVFVLLCVSRYERLMRFEDEDFEGAISSALEPAFREVTRCVMTLAQAIADGQSSLSTFERLLTEVLTAVRNFHMPLTGPFYRECMAALKQVDYEMPPADVLGRLEARMNKSVADHFEKLTNQVREIRIDVRRLFAGSGI